MNNFYKAHVLYVIDGSTFDADVELGFNVRARVRFDLLEVDVPRFSSAPPNSSQLDVCKNLKAVLMDELVGRNILVKSYKSKVPNRWFCECYIKDNVDGSVTLPEVDDTNMYLHVNELMRRELEGLTYEQ